MIIIEEWGSMLWSQMQEMPRKWSPSASSNRFVTLDCKNLLNRGLSNLNKPNSMELLQQQGIRLWFHIQ